MRGTRALCVRFSRARAADVRRVQVRSEAGGAWAVDLREMHIDAVGRGGATRRCVRDVNGVARVAWPGGVRHVDVRLEELGGGITPTPPPSSCTDWTRLVLLPVLTGHVSSFPRRHN